MFNWIPACFSTVSVVIIAIDAFLAPSISLDKLPTNWGMPFFIASILRGTPITPVEATSTSSFLILNALAQRWVIFFAFDKPSSPLQVLAFPLLIIIAWAFLLIKCCLVIVSGAPFTLFFV